MTIAFLTKGIPWIVPLTSWGLLMFPLYNIFHRKYHKRFLTIDSKFLYIKWRPKKLVKDKKYPIDEIDQIYVKNVSGFNTIYMVVNSDDGQKHIRLIGQIRSFSKARYLEQEIERHLGIKDREVPEETK